MTRTRVIVAAVCLTGLVLRLIGLQFGLPAVYNPDEVAIMARALAFAKGSLNPHNFLYPTFYFYVLFVWVGAYLAALFVTRRVDSIAALQQLYFTSPTGIYAAGRALGVACGTATIAVLYRLGERLGGVRAGLAAAVFLAVSPLHVRDSHYVKHDVPATLAIVVAYTMMARAWRNGPGEAGEATTPAPGPPAMRETIVAGAATGVAFSTHYYCIFLALPLAWAIYCRMRVRGGAQVLRHLAAAAVSSAVVFFALSPFLLLEPLTALADVRANRAIVVDRAIAGGAFGPAVRYAQMLWQDSAGIPVVILALIGVAWMSVVEWRRALFLLAFPVPFLAFIANTAPASRYLNPVLPFIALFAGWVFARVASRWNARPMMFWALLTAAAAPSLLASIRADLFFRQPDTRTLALDYIESRIPAGSGILIQPYSVVLTPTRESLVEALTLTQGSVEAASAKFQLQLDLQPYPEPAYRLVYLGSGGLDADKLYVTPEETAGTAGLERLRRLGVAFVVLKRYNRSDQGSLPILSALEREGRRLAAFSPYRPGIAAAEQARIDPFLHNTDTRIDGALERPGPPLEIWQIDGSGVRQP